MKFSSEAEFEKVLKSHYHLSGGGGTVGQANGGGKAIQVEYILMN